MRTIPSQRTSSRHPRDSRPGSGHGKSLPISAGAPSPQNLAGTSLPFTPNPKARPRPAAPLQYFAGKRVRVAVHQDDAGRKAGERWAQQLYRAGATLVDGFHFDGMHRQDGRRVEDLADFATLLDPEDPPVERMLADLTGSTRS